MIKFKSGNILEDKSEAIVNPVNCAGIMGAGLALQFKEKYPLNFTAYREACNDGILDIGRSYVYSFIESDTIRRIINFPTKDDWRDLSRVEYIELGLKDLVSQIEIYDIREIAIPLLGAGLGGLDEVVIRDILIKAFEEIDKTVFTLYMDKSLWVSWIKVYGYLEK